MFQKKYQESVMKYKNKKRLTKALELLKEHTVSDTAVLLGYSSIYTFSRAYKSYYGFSPSHTKGPQT